MSLDITVELNGNTVELKEKCADKALLQSIGCKETLCDYLAALFPTLEFPLSCNDVVIERLSKKRKQWVELRTEQNFDELKRSLKVKSKLKLNVKFATSAALTFETGVEELGREFMLTIYSLINDVKSSEVWDVIRGFAKKTPPPQVCGSMTFAHGAVCDSCYPNVNAKSTRITGIRYSCTECPDFDLCQGCFEAKVAVGLHKSTHAMMATFRATHGEQAPSVLSNAIANCSPETREYVEAIIQKRGLEAFVEISNVFAEKARRFDMLRRVFDERGDEVLDWTNFFAVPLCDEKERIEELKNRDKTWELDSKWEERQHWAQDGELEQDGKPGLESVWVFDKLEREVDGVGMNDAAEALAAPGEGSSQGAKHDTGDTLTTSADGEQKVEFEVPSAGELRLTVVHKSAIMSQVVLVNKTNVSIDCSRFTIRFHNCLNSVVAKADAHCTHTLKPGMTIKTNVNLLKGHMQHPFKVELDFGYFTTDVRLNANNLCGECPVPKEPVGLVGTAPHAGLAPQAELAALGVLAELSVHSVVVPLLPKESVVYDADDFDVLSMGDADDVSDYEVLSHATLDSE